MANLLSQLQVGDDIALYDKDNGSYPCVIDDQDIAGVIQRIEGDMLYIQLEELIKDGERTVGVRRENFSIPASRLAAECVGGKKYINVRRKHKFVEIR